MESLVAGEKQGEVEITSAVAALERFLRVNQRRWFYGIGIALIDLKCEILHQVDYPHNFPHRVLPPEDEDSHQLLAKIDSGTVTRILITCR